MGKNLKHNDHDDEEIIKRPKNYPFCHNADTVVNSENSDDKQHYDTVNLYKYC